MAARATYSCHSYNGEKMKIGIYCHLIADFFTKHYRNVPWVFLYQNAFFVITSSFDWLPWQPIGKVCEKYLKKINSSEAVWGIKLKLCSIVSNISLYKIVIFIAVAHPLWLLWQLKVSIDLQWEKWKLRFTATSLQKIWQKFYRNVID